MEHFNQFWCMYANFVHENIQRPTKLSWKHFILNFKIVETGVYVTKLVWTINFKNIRKMPHRDNFLYRSQKVCVCIGCLCKFGSLYRWFIDLHAQIRFVGYFQANRIIGYNKFRCNKSTDWWNINFSTKQRRIVSCFVPKL